MTVIVSLLLGSSMATYYQPAPAYVAPQQQYYTTAKPYYAAPPQQYYTTTAKPYYPTTTYAPYTTTRPYQETYTTQQQSYYQQPTTKGYAQPSYVQPQTYYTTKGSYAPAAAAQPSYYTTPSTYYQKPSSASYYSTTPSYYGGAADSGYEGDQNGWYNYAFKFNVNDYYGNEQSRSETREADLTRGQYSVNLPDGRKQVVSYEADQNGYRADVSYEPADSGNSDPQNYYSTAAYSTGY